MDLVARNAEVIGGNLVLHVFSIDEGGVRNKVMIEKGYQYQYPIQW